MKKTDDDHIRDLVRDLRPVRPIPRLSGVLAASAAVWIAAAVGWRALGGAQWRTTIRSDWSDPSFVAILLGLGLGAIGSTLAALALAVPGRDGAARGGLVVGATGLVVAIASGLASTPFAGLRFDPAELFSCFACISRSTVLGALSVLVSCGFIGRAVARRPNSAAALAIIGGVALGAIVVHASCDATEGAHRLVSHVLAPMIAAATLTLPISLGLRFSSGRR